MNQNNANRVVPHFSFGGLLTLALVFVLTGCGSSYSPPPLPISVGLSLTVASVQAGIGTQNLTATVQNDSQYKGVTWALTQAGANCAPGCGSISAQTSPSGTPITYTAPSNQPSSTSVTLAATSVSDSSKSQAATITVTLPVSVVVSPSSSMIQFNAIQFFTATIQNDAANQGVNWTLTQSGANCSSACGTVSPSTSLSGAAIKYTGPSSVPTNPSVTLMATSKTDPARNAPAAITVTVNPGNVGITVAPKRAGITRWQTQTIVPTITATSNTSVLWDVDGTPGGSAALGTVNAAGVYTPPTTPGTHVITATSQADVTKNASTTIGVTDLAGVYTYHNDISRTGANLKEFALTTTNANTATFGKLFSVPVDGYVYAQPLWMANVNFGGTIHNVVFVATEHDSLYAIDADNGTILWQQSFINLPAGISTLDSNNDIGCGDLVPEVGITSTPVIDPSTNTIYVLVRTKENGSYLQRLHAIDVITGNEKPGGPKIIHATAPITGGGTVTFDPFIQAQRPALLLHGGHIVISWASHCDHNGVVNIYHGWVMSYNAGTLAQEAVFNTSPNGTWAGVWMSGNGPAADAGGNIYFATGNGSWNGTDAYGDSIVKLGPANAGNFASLDYFTPFNQGNLDGADTDVGSGGVLLLPDLSGGANPHLLVQVGKEGKIYIVDTGNLGQICTVMCNGVDPQIVQESPAGFIGGMWGSPAYWNGNLYFGGVSDSIKALSVSSGAQPLAGSPSSQSTQGFGYPGPTPSVSSSGNTNGIVWALDNTNQSVNNGQILYGYDATNLATELYDTTQNAGRDTGGGAVKFNVPTVANGKVYVGGQSTLTVYGLLPN